MDRHQLESKKKLVPFPRTGFGTEGRKIPLLSNHFMVNISKVDEVFIQYSVDISYEDGQPFEDKGVGRKVINKVIETYDSELGGKKIAYDGDKSLFTVGALPNNKLEFVVVFEDVVSSSSRNTNDADRKRIKRMCQSKTYNVVLRYAAKIPIQAITNAIRGEDSQNTQEALRVLEIILRQHAANQGCLLLRQSFFHNHPKNFARVGGGVLGFQGFRSSFRGIQTGLSLNIDVSTTMILEPGPVLDFIKANQNVRNQSAINWAMARRMLKNMMIKSATSNQEHKIRGLSDNPCNRQKFIMKKKGSRDQNGAAEEIEITVYDYFVNVRKINLHESADFPCINIGKPKSPTFIPLEALSSNQRASLVEKSRQKPQERMNILSDALRTSKYDMDPVLRSCGISISKDFVRIEGRILPTPKLKGGNGEDLFANNGRWNFNKKKFVAPKNIEDWVIVNFSALCNLKLIVRELIKVGQMKGIHIKDPRYAFEENQEFRTAPPTTRVQKMFDMIKFKCNRDPDFILCVLPERKNSDIYGPWKKKILADKGIVTQCMAPPANLNDQYLTNLLLKINAKLGGLNSILSVEPMVPPAKVNDQYLTNLLLKINAKLGGLNSILSVEPMVPPAKVNDQYLTNLLLKINAKLGRLNSILSVDRTPAMPLVSRTPTMILGMDVSHGARLSDVPSIVAVVGSREWPLISRYRACVRTQSSRVKMIDNLLKPVSGNDHGIIRELLNEFYDSSGHRLHIASKAISCFLTVFSMTGGVSESQFNQVLNIELSQIIEACKLRDESWNPKFLLIVAQKNHHTRFFQPHDSKNVPPGTIIYRGVCHPRNNDFYFCAHAGMIIGVAPDELQELVHNLSYNYQKSTTAISVVSPIMYAHLAAAQMGQMMKFEDGSETSSSHGGEVSAAGPAACSSADENE